MNSRRPDAQRALRRLIAASVARALAARRLKADHAAPPPAPARRGGAQDAEASEARRAPVVGDRG